eukprot:IDg8778t1
MATPISFHPLALRAAHCELHLPLLSRLHSLRDAVVTRWHMEVAEWRKVIRSYSDFCKPAHAQRTVFAPIISASVPAIYRQHRAALSLAYRPSISPLASRFSMRCCILHHSALETDALSYCVLLNAVHLNSIHAHLEIKPNL